MARQIFVNLPIRDMKRSRDFFSALGFTFNPQFSNDQGACMVISEGIHAMLLVEPFFRSFIDTEISDARKVTEVLTCISCESRAEVDDLVKKAVAAGGRAHRQPQDHGFMYGHGFVDPDGHIWELSFIDPHAAPPQA